MPIHACIHAGVGNRGESNTMLAPADEHVNSLQYALAVTKIVEDSRPSSRKIRAGSCILSTPFKWGTGQAGEGS